MLTGPIYWLHAFLNGKDDPETPYLSEFIGDHMPPLLQEVFHNKVTKITPNAEKPQSKDSKPDKLALEVWQSDFYSKLGKNRLGIAFVALQNRPTGKTLVQRIKNRRFPAHFFVQIHKPYLAIWGTSEFGTIFPDVPTDLYEKYISMFLDLYDISFYEFDLVFLLQSSTNIAKIVEFYESICNSDPSILREHLRLCRKEHQSSLYNMNKV